MKRLIAILPMCAIALYASVATIPASASTAPQVVTISASSSAMFSPSVITVHAGQPVEIKFVGKSGVHEVASTDLGIPTTLLTPGATKTVTFTPAKAGTYTLHCLIPCGPDHSKMTITINVV